MEHPIKRLLLLLFTKTVRRCVLKKLKLTNKKDIKTDIIDTSRSSEFIHLINLYTTGITHLPELLLFKARLSSYPAHHLNQMT